jgi:uncharacterized protein
MASGRNQLTIIQNHEITPFMTTYGVPLVPGTVYDPGAVNAGGCTVSTTDGDGRSTAVWATSEQAALLDLVLDRGAANIRIAP